MFHSPRWQTLNSLISVFGRLIGLISLLGVLDLVSSWLPDEYRFESTSEIAHKIGFVAVSRYAMLCLILASIYMCFEIYHSERVSAKTDIHRSHQASSLFFLNTLTLVFLALFVQNNASSKLSIAADKENRDVILEKIDTRERAIKSIIETAEIGIKKDISLSEGRSEFNLSQINRSILQLIGADKSNISYIMKYLKNLSEIKNREELLAKVEKYSKLSIEGAEQFRKSFPNSNCNMAGFERMNYASEIALLARNYGRYNLSFVYDYASLCHTGPQTVDEYAALDASVEKQKNIFSYLKRQIELDIQTSTADNERILQKISP